jgi:hypothetical protein
VRLVPGLALTHRDQPGANASPRGSPGLLSRRVSRPVWGLDCLSRTSTEELSRNPRGTLTNTNATYVPILLMEKFCWKNRGFSVLPTDHCGARRTSSGQVDDEVLHNRACRHGAKVGMDHRFAPGVTLQSGGISSKAMREMVPAS